MNSDVADFNQRLIDSAQNRLPLGSRLNPSWCRDKKLFEEICEAFPSAPVTLHIQDFNDTKSITAIELSIPQIAEGDWVPGEGNRVYCHRVNLLSAFPLLGDKSPIGDGKRITMDEFINAGPTLAALLGRKVTLLHQRDSGDQSGVSFEVFGPFMPVYNVIDGTANEDPEPQRSLLQRFMEWMRGFRIRNLVGR